LRKSERPMKRATSSWGLATSRSSGTRRTETHAHAVGRAYSPRISIGRSLAS
jgi:hypothetical protein